MPSTLVPYPHNPCGVCGQDYVAHANGTIVGQAHAFAHRSQIVPVPGRTSTRGG